jgi:hypothetical protein
MTQILASIASNQIFLAVIFIMCFSGMLVLVGLLFGWFTTAKSDEPLAENQGGNTTYTRWSNQRIDPIGE